MIKHLFAREGTERNSGRIKTENFYYTVIYDVLREQDHHMSKALALRKLKAKIIRLNSSHRQRLVVDTGEQDRIEGGEPSLHYLLKTRKRQATRLINQIYGDNGILQTSTASILKVSTSFHSKQKHIQIVKRSIRRVAGCGVKTVTPETKAVLEEPIPLEKLRHAITQGKSNKAPGQDGIYLEFFRTAWDVIKRELLQIMNHIHIDGRTSARQWQGLIVCLPKTPHPKNVDDYRSLTLLNSGYIILSRIVANRIRPC